MSLLKRIGIHLRILSSVVLIIISLTMSLGYFGVSIINQFVSKRFDKHIDFMAEHLARNSELGLLVDQPELLRGLALQMVNEEDIAVIKILNKKNALVVDVSSKIKGPYKIIEKDVKTRISVSSQDFFFSSDSDDNKAVIGKIKIMYSTGQIKSLLDQMKTKFIVTSSVLAVFSCIAFYFISRSIVMPLNSLVYTAKEVSLGNRKIRAVYGDTPETARLAAAFNEMLDSLAYSRMELIKAHEKMAKQESLAELGKFSMMIAHEVKNPLGIIKSSLEILKRELNVSKDYIPYKYSIEELSRLNDLIESFLMFSKPASPKFKRIDLNAVVNQVIMGFEIRYEKSDLKIISEIPETPFFTEADFDLIARAVSNIIKNACEANNEKGEIKITVSDDNLSWLLKIEDQGKGISEENLEKIFEPFFTNKAKGTGLGLAFASQVIKAHGGYIRAENVLGSGAVFIVTLF